MLVSKMHWHDILVSVFSGSALSKANIFHYITCSFMCFVILKISHHQLISHNLKWNQVPCDGKSEVKGSVSHSGPTCSPEDKAIQKCHVLLPVLKPVNWWILVFVSLICSLQAEVPGDTCWSRLIILRTFIFVVAFRAPLHVSCLSTHLYIL